MEPGSSLDRPPRPRPKPGPWPPRIEPFVPANTDFNPRDLRSWARRTGFNVSGESAVSRGEAATSGVASVGGGDQDLEKGLRTEIESAAADEGFKGRRKKKSKQEVELKDEGSSLNGDVKESEGSALNLNGGRGMKEEDGGGTGSGSGNGGGKRDLDLEVFSDTMEPEINPSDYKSGPVCGLTDNPGYGQLKFLVNFVWLIF